MSIFDNVAFPKNKRNVFNLSHEVGTTCAFGQLVPILCEEVLPGDTFQLSTQLFVRAMPMVAPLMHRVNIYTHFFFVPNRLVWDNWKDFITGGEDGTAEPVFPKVIITNTDGVGSLADHLGLSRPEGIRPVEYVNALPFRAYNLIWNEYYRDQNLQEEIEISTEDGIDDITPRNVLKRNWEKDYFTSALPWTQRGPVAVSPIEFNDDLEVSYDRNVREPFIILDKTTNEPDELGSNLTTADSAGGELVRDNLPTSANRLAIDPNGNYVVSGQTTRNANALDVNVNELRRSIALQKWLEANARGGARYIEQIFSHFGVVSSDATLQRPQYLGGGRQPLSISEVLQTSESTDSSPLGDMAGHGVSAATTKQFRRYFEEHGFVIGIMSIMPKSKYQEGTRRFFGKFDKFDYAFPEFANLGEQEVYNSEIYNSNGINADSGTFGYQSRYCEYKYIPSTLHGDLRTEPFAPWTLTRKFSELPKLNSEFIEVDTFEEDLGRIFPVEDSYTQFVVQLYHKFKAVRILPKHVIPSI